MAVDTNLNGSNSYANQFKHFESEYKVRLKRTRQKRREAKFELKTSDENVDSETEE